MATALNVTETPKDFLATTVVTEKAFADAFMTLRNAHEAFRENKPFGNWLYLLRVCLTALEQDASRNETCRR
jgi:hypothetical protein